MRRIFTISLIIVSLIISTGLLIFRAGVGRAENTPPPPPPPGSFVSGTWQGQGSLADGRRTFDMALTLNVTNTIFAGDMRSVALGSEAIINGSVSSTFGNIIGLTFVPSQIIQGTQFQSGSIYNATFTDGRIRGSWNFPGHISPPDGSFTLDPVVPATPVANPPQIPIQPPQPTQPPAPTQPPQPTQPPVPTQPPPSTPVNQSRYVPSGNGKQANVTAVLTWYGFNDNSAEKEEEHNSALIAHPKNAGNPTLHNVATEGSGSFDDPITFAARNNDEKTFPVGSVIYVPLTHKYYIMEDLCGDTDAGGCANGAHHVDLWMGPSTPSGSALLNCENNHTPGGTTEVIINPSPSLPVDITPAFSEGKCTLHTYK